MENSEPSQEGVCPPPPPHRCIFSTARQAPHKAADIVHCPLAEVLRGCGLLPIHEESPHGAWVGGGGITRTMASSFLFSHPHLLTFAQIVQRCWTDDD